MFIRRGTPRRRAARYPKGSRLMCAQKTTSYAPRIAAETTAHPKLTRDPAEPVSKRIPAGMLVMDSETTRGSATTSVTFGCVPTDVNMSRLNLAMPPRPPHASVTSASTLIVPPPSTDGTRIAPTLGGLVGRTLDRFLRSATDGLASQSLFSGDS